MLSPFPSRRHLRESLAKGGGRSRGEEGKRPFCFTHVSPLLQLRSFGRRRDFACASFRLQLDALEPKLLWLTNTLFFTGQRHFRSVFCCLCRHQKINRLKFASGVLFLGEKLETPSGPVIFFLSLTTARRGSRWLEGLCERKCRFPSRPRAPLRNGRNGRRRPCGVACWPRCVCECMRCGVCVMVCV